MSIMYRLLGLIPWVRKTRLEFAYYDEVKKYCYKKIEYHQNVIYAIDAERAFIRLLRRRNELISMGYPYDDNTTLSYFAR